MTGGRPAIIDGVHYSLDFLRESGGPAIVGLGLALLLADRRPRVLWLIAAVAAVQAAVTVVAGGDWMHHYRFYAPVLPLLAAAMGAGAACLIAQADRRRAPPPAGPVDPGVGPGGGHGPDRQDRAGSGPPGDARGPGGRVPVPTATAGWASGSRTTRRRRPWWPSAMSVRWGIFPSAGSWTCSAWSILTSPGGLVACISRTTPQYVLEQQPEVIVLVAGGDDPRLNRLFCACPTATCSPASRFGAEYELVHSEPIAFRGERVLIYRRR